MRRAIKTLQFPFDKYSEAQVQHAFGETIYNAGIYFGHSTARELWPPVRNDSAEKTGFLFGK